MRLGLGAPLSDPYAAIDIGAHVATNGRSWHALTKPAYGVGPSVGDGGVWAPAGPPGGRTPLVWAQAVRSGYARFEPPQLAETEARRPSPR